jgi:hypothetical protein
MFLPGFGNRFVTMLAGASVFKFFVHLATMWAIYIFDDVLEFGFLPPLLRLFTEFVEPFIDAF